MTLIIIASTGFSVSPSSLTFTAQSGVASSGVLARRRHHSRHQRNLHRYIQHQRTAFGLCWAQEVSFRLPDSWLCRSTPPVCRLELRVGHITVNGFIVADRACDSCQTGAQAAVTVSPHIVANHYQVGDPNHRACHPS